MSEWNHSICNECWTAGFGIEPGSGRSAPLTPVRLVDPKKEVCCFCGKEHQSGIYVRKNPEMLQCKGKTGIHKGE